LPGTNVRGLTPLAKSVSSPDSVVNSAFAFSRSYT